MLLRAYRAFSTREQKGRGLDQVRQSRFPFLYSRYCGRDVSSTGDRERSGRPAVDEYCAQSNMLPIVSAAVPFKARAIVEAMMLLRAQQIGRGATTTAVLLNIP